MSSDIEPRWSARRVQALADELHEYALSIESQEVRLTGARRVYRQSTSEHERDVLNREISAIRAELARLRRQVQRKIGGID